MTMGRGVWELDHKKLLSVQRNPRSSQNLRSLQLQFYSHSRVLETNFGDRYSYKNMNRDGEFKIDNVH